MTEVPRLRWIQWILVLTLPVSLLAANLRLVTSHRFVRWEYRRAGFPSDPFGLSTAERIRLAEVCQDYLATNADISLLADLRLSSGEPAFNQRELRHMADVQAVYFALTIAGVIAALLWIGGATMFAASGRAREVIPVALLNGSLFTVGLLAAIALFMVISWGQFFTTFHRLFFEGNTWIFPPSDTLIRLFPNRFWIDIGATIVGLLFIEGLAVGVASWMWRRKPPVRNSS
ncbi:MAG: TIGR01906 family membrane protein [Anaerolineae bacterium]|jgi:integral membrane protein (TIGR01906 family)